MIWLAVATAALPVMNCLQRGQVGIALLYLLVLGARLVLLSASMRGVFAGGIVLALAVTIKLTPLLPVGLLALLLWMIALRTRASYCQSVLDVLARGELHRAWATAAGQVVGLALFVIVVPGLIVGQSANLSHLQTWVTRVVANDDVGVDNEFNAKSKRNQSLSNAARRLGNRLLFAAGLGPDDRLVDDLANAAVQMPMETRAVDLAIKAMAAVIIALLLFCGWRVAGDGELSAVLAVFGLACMATLAVSPLSWGHHYVVWLPALLFVPFWMWHNGRRAIAAGLAESACALVWAHYVLLDHAGRVGLLGIGSTVWYLVAVTVICRPAADEVAAKDQDDPTICLTDAPQRRLAA